ncbi:phosphoribosylformylglycinamidine synthase subunit PurS [Halobacillus litoralis]|jgi:phosphoribosylformylglycinamidine synthase|uniref:Phosphoribosylformylglycinamidine synthase subunit PurS n=4 Tax=Halobacillus TaxID=45667 RepID=A0A3D8VME0_9BACI|nr:MULTISPECIES: phosphoribosylformylglycinamidine synthase subunit PurS [Halobacillus]MBN9654838.1 phosphoribosylformylglycinamidine synthase subunit PurS [Halobacillus sp. GSS1]MEC3885193.1 phosphoribosylformylglycinamidine synthase subunit PurS [Halobacillus sp. HZG1]MYL71333.1 phosphoribosylformylglycinamidine synthase subunit PurS [Halobacillus litoralis]RDY70564.1 phosphoribosylformylglycinamidine synthase subunit PurS [Halobacillus trueperi]REJ09240.1 phosphoribosylformylglycinamidine s
MRKVKIHITLKEGVLDPQGKAVHNSLQSLEYNNVQDVRVGKYMEVMVEDSDNLEAEIDRMCDQLLANPVIENYSYTIEEAG